MLDRGVLRVIDNQIDQTTGTIRLKAEFPNATLQLWPGQFANVRLLVDTLRRVVVVPTASLQQGPNGPYVYIISEDGVANVRLVKVSQQDERNTVLADGVKPGERVATSSFVRLRDGSQVNATLAPPPSNGVEPSPGAATPAITGKASGASGADADGRGQGGGKGEGKRRRDAGAAQGTTPGQIPGQIPGTAPGTAAQ